MKETHEQPPIIETVDEDGNAIYQVRVIGHLKVNKDKEEDK